MNSGLLLAGCSADRAVIRDIYLLAISYRNSSAPEGFNLRVGYFGICAQKLNEGGWTCGREERELGITQNMDPVTIIEIAQKFKDDIAFSGLQ
jgi:hypothetical protein